MGFSRLFDQDRKHLVSVSRICPRHNPTRAIHEIWNSDRPRYLTRSYKVLNDDLRKHFHIRARSDYSVKKWWIDRNTLHLFCGWPVFFQAFKSPYFYKLLNTNFWADSSGRWRILSGVFRPKLLLSELCGYLQRNRNSYESADSSEIGNFASEIPDKKFETAIISSVKNCTLEMDRILWSEACNAFLSLHFFAGQPDLSSTRFKIISQGLVFIVKNEGWSEFQIRAQNYRQLYACVPVVAYLPMLVDSTFIGRNER